MCGNVWELCFDWKGDITTMTSEMGQETGTYKVRRGGAYNERQDYCDLSSRFGSRPHEGGSTSEGFRVVRNAD